AFHASFKPELPYVVAIIELEEGPKMMSNVIGLDPDDVYIGLPVEVEFEDASDTISLPRFRVAKGAARPGGRPLACTARRPSPASARPTTPRARVCPTRPCNYRPWSAPSPTPGCAATRSTASSPRPSAPASPSRALPRTLASRTCASPS